MQFPEELWKDIPGYDGVYQVSTFGRIRSFSKVNARDGRLHIRRPGLTNGYYKVCLYDKHSKVKAISVHKLVATAFIPNPNDYPVINHIDCNKLNNNINNLEWCTRKHNTQHAVRMGLFAPKYFKHKSKKRPKK
ncbi:NUMOD4 domain-containing protein [Hymenobacter koreensis]|uniref:HNH nuclease domain-containing protein n=1 Tax=Hymenobacter koreensis TaxID=1084523 RepID=A0ABP8JJ62_9BACT